MTFVQLIECKTGRVDDMNRLMDTWVEQTKGKRTATHAIVGRDRSDATHIVEMVEFPSYEEAQRNSSLPETNRIFEEMVALCDEPPTFTDLDVLRDEQLNKQSALRLFEEVIAKGDLGRLDEFFAADYHDHDVANEEDTRGVDGIRREIEGYRAAFDFEFTVDSALADGDEVAVRWSWLGRHIGDFGGISPTNENVSFTGVTSFHFHNGKIVEGWWNWDNLAMLRQVGAITP
ncbi:ester cyclase [Embleya scabrispora]|uniref:ester cyclase n=1 Tax=Embleya scabrispora TaxID=159449 RepID=UPI0003643F8B|nr:ester cyclase [Embleya scabrispora]MYS84691.1 ester cyclase [Streptomyces sp. SID5474]